eukprot:g44713.t1
MGEPNELAEGVGAINLAGGGFWKTYQKVSFHVSLSIKKTGILVFDKVKQYQQKRISTCKFETLWNSYGVFHDKETS